MLPQLTISLRLHFRNRLALIYSYLFPTIFLIAFWVLYRYDQVPLVRHLGALLTVTILGGACFGLPTTLVSEREKGVWRRYRLAPVATGAIVVSTVVARYVLLLIAGLLQIALAIALGMPIPPHPIDLWLAFTCVAVAFLGLGLVIAMLAPNVPAVQALGQCVFLPMLILGGVAVPLASLPRWAQQLAGFFPGRYAVDAIQATVTGPGLGAARFSVMALLLMGGAGCLAASRLFRWDAQQRLATGAAAGGVAVALAAWIAVGAAAMMRSERNIPAAAVARDETPSIPFTPAVQLPAMADTVKPELPPAVPAQPIPRRAEAAPIDAAPTSAARGKPIPKTEPGEPPSEPAAPPASSSSSSASGWRAVTVEQIERDVRFDRLPPDSGVVTPIAPEYDEPDTDLANQLDYMASALLSWKPAQVTDPVQRVRNVLYVAAVPDVFQMDPLERFVPWVVFEHLRQTVPQSDLIKILYWIAMHPTEGDDSAVDQLRELRLGNGPSDMEQTRERTALYAVKLLGRLLGKIK